MAVVTLSELWIHDGVDLGDYVTTYGFAREEEASEVTGEVRTYANGRRRIVRRAGSRTTLAVTFPAVDRSTVDWLRQHQGVLVLVRDPITPVGRMVWGTYFALAVPERGGGSLPHVSLNLESVTHSEEV